MSRAESYPIRSGAGPGPDIKPPTMPTTVPTEAKVPGELNALARLAASRARLQVALLEITHPPKPEPLFAEGMVRAGDRLLARIKRNSAAALAIEAAQGWWRQHPLHTASTLAADASEAVVRPYAQRKPANLMLLAIVIGAVLMLLRPWRLLFRPKFLLSIMTSIGWYALKTRATRDLLGAFVAKS